MNKSHEMKQQNIFQATIVVLSLICAYAVLRLAFPVLYLNELTLGWSLAFLNHFAAGRIKSLSAQKKAQTAIYFLTTLNFLRFFLFLIFVFCVTVILPIHTNAFIYALLGAYVVFLTGDLINFYQLNKVRS